MTPPISCLSIELAFCYHLHFLVSLLHTISAPAIGTFATCKLRTTCLVDLARYTACREPASFTCSVKRRPPLTWRRSDGRPTPPGAVGGTFAVVVGPERVSGFAIRFRGGFERDCTMSCGRPWLAPAGPWSPETPATTPAVLTLIRHHPHRERTTQDAHANHYPAITNCVQCFQGHVACRGHKRSR